MGGGPADKSNRRRWKRRKRIAYSTHGNCPRTGKTCYPRPTAEAFAKEQRRRGDRTFVEYHCGACDWWHVGHQQLDVGGG